MKLKMKFKYQIIVFFMFIFYIFYTLITNFTFQISKIIEYKKEIDYLNQSIKSTEKEITKMKNNQNKNYDLEKLARERLNMVKPDEIVYIDIKKR